MELQGSGCSQKGWLLTCCQSSLLAGSLRSMPSMSACSSGLASARMGQGHTRFLAGTRLASLIMRSFARAAACSVSISTPCACDVLLQHLQGLHSLRASSKGGIVHCAAHVGVRDLCRLGYKSS